MSASKPSMGMLTIYIVSEVMYRVKSRQAGEALPGHEK